MKFVLITFIYFITLQYRESHQYAIYPLQFYNPSYINGYAQTTTFRLMQPTTTTVYNDYRNLIPPIPENRKSDLPKKPTLNVEPSRSPSRWDNLLLRMKLSMMEMAKNQDQSATDQPSKTIANPNAKTYKGKTTKKTLASFRSASV